MQLLQRVFINRDYGLLFTGKLVSQIGDGIHYFALTWLVLDLTGSGTALGTLLMAASLPGVILLPFSGVLADTMDRKKIVVTMDIMRGLVMLTIGAVYFTGKITLPILYIATIFQSLCSVLFNPAITATIPNLVEKDQLIQANARDTFSQSATGILGPIAGAFLLGFLGYAGVFVINGMSFLLSAVSESFIRFPKKPITVTKDGFSIKLKSGFVYVWNNTGMRTIILFALGLNFLINPIFSVVLPFFGKEVVGMDAQLYGFTQSSYPAGLLIGTLLVGIISRHFAKVKLLITGISAEGFLIMVLGILSVPTIYQNVSIYTMLVLMVIPIFLMGIFNVQINVPFRTLLQEIVPDDFRGRVFGLIDSITQMLVPFSTALVGGLADYIPLTYLFLISGLTSCLIAVAIAMSQSISAIYQATSTITNKN